uniref:Cobaltochelatase CobT subunit n=1 Tax=Candidatus Kentrum eta TaxID=2126337 RepID=A0A450VC58_9GAMM|nr:MAG: cobaltochelatase CobT subunit [Candidatus Kentron sp. H]VFK02365.1 MAG: cobaltochelatase CobT subunit [Candidatus Kentron sp. H]VFK05427.1 MAG: cobaltochelatase CobT subunit [Candidatus Kentron sp. H]
METKTERLRRVTAATCRAIARRDDIIVSFEEDRSVPSGAKIRLGPPTEDIHPQEIARIRSDADTGALRLAHHDTRLHDTLAPVNEAARTLFDVLEQVRYEALGARRMNGIAVNLTHSLERYCHARELNAVTQREPRQLPEAVRLLAREAIEGVPPPDAARHFAKLWREFLLPEIGELFPDLAHAMDNQSDFALASRAILGKLGFPMEATGTREEIKAELREGGEGEADRKPEPRPGESPPEIDPMESVDIMEGTTEDPGSGEMPWDESDAAREHTEHDSDEEKEEHARHGFRHNKPAEEYRVYTTEFDEIVEAPEICNARELVRFRLELDRELAMLQSVIGRLANRLQRRLLARQARSWEFDQEEGLLDTARLTRIIANPASSLSYKREKETPFRDTVVTLLIDNSGSMRGRPITLAAISADVLARTLERCAVKTEILGFTTRTWKGGRLQEHWTEAGKKPNPGRLNELRHIIYKSADIPWRRARRNLGLMLREGLLKENIDGEALLWAYQRLIARNEQRRILMVISDGTPVDDATLSTNSGDYLDRHLHQVIQYIENESPVELLAIGVGHDVAQYYRRAATLVDVEQLSGTMMEELANLFDGKAERLHPYR